MNILDALGIGLDGKPPTEQQKRLLRLLVQSTPPEILEEGARSTARMLADVFKMIAKRSGTDDPKVVLRAMFRSMAGDPDTEHKYAMYMIFGCFIDHCLRKTHTMDQFLSEFEPALVEHGRVQIKKMKETGAV